LVRQGSDADVASDGLICRRAGRSGCAAVMVLRGRGGIALGRIWSRQLNRQFVFSHFRSVAT
jgi:hypothetical protein